MIGRELQPREKMLAGVTMIGALLVVISLAGGGEFIDSVVSRFTEGDAEVLALEKRFNENLDALEQMYIIERDFKRVGSFPTGEDGNLKPALAFTQQVSQMCTDMGFTFPPIRPEVEAIEGVEEYELINVAVKTEGSYQDTMRLLKEFERNGLIFREVDLKATRDREILVARITVARIAEKPQRPTARFSGPRR